MLGGMSKAVHWADNYAEKIIHEKGDKELYVCASGITPSGTVHIGNLREIITVELVVRALRERGKKVRFICSWDDYDVFRKVPDNMPNREMLQGYLRQPINLTPDPSGVEESYARRNEKEIEELLPIVGIEPEYIYQAERYRSSAYAEGIRRALEHRDRLREILSEHRKEPLPDHQTGKGSQRLTLEFHFRYHHCFPAYIPSATLHLTSLPGFVIGYPCYAQGHREVRFFVS